MGLIVLFYKYIEIEYPERIRKWQHKIATDLHLKGRVLIAHEGINGTLGGSDEDIKRFIAIMQKNPLFADIDFKISPGCAQSYPRLRVAVRPEIVTFNAHRAVSNPALAGQHLTPEQAHDLLSEHHDVVVLDARNNYESRIGHFKNALLPNIDHFRDLPGYIDDNLDRFQDKTVLMYCTGGIRCERASAYLKAKGVAAQVYQLSGGIESYINKFPNGFFRGKNYVFDGRVSITVNNDVLSTCDICASSCDEYHNCINATCNEHFIACASCMTSLSGACSSTCQTLLATHQVTARPAFIKTEFTSCSINPE